MDKRRSPRYAISLKTLVHPSAGSSWFCDIKDFCHGGMLLVQQDRAQRRRGARDAVLGDQVGIHFSIPGDQGGLHFRLEGRIVRAMDASIGISFPEGMPEDAMDALLDYSNRMPVATGASPENKVKSGKDLQAANLELAAGPTKDDSVRGDKVTSDQGITQQDAQKIIAEVRKLLARAIPEMSTAFFDYMDTELLSAASDAKSNAEQSEYFMAMSILEKAKKHVSQSFNKRVLDQIDNPRDLDELLTERRGAENRRKVAQQNQRIRLSLVDADEFEDWLAVANSISKMERLYEKYLVEIQTRLGYLVESWSHNEANPLCPAVIARAFNDALRDVALSKEIRQKAYSGFDSKVIPTFRKLYVSVTRMLEASGVFPDIEEDFVSPMDTSKESLPSLDQIPEDDADDLSANTEEDLSKDNVEDLPEGHTDDLPDALDQDEEMLLEQLRQHSEASRAARRPDAGKRPRVKKPAGSPARTPRSRKVGKALDNIYSTIRDLINIQEGVEEEEYSEEDVLQVEEVEVLLNSLQLDSARQHGDRRSGDRRSSIKDQLLAALKQHGGGRRLDAVAREGLEVVDNLVETIEDDSMLSPNSVDWIRSLELTLTKVAAREGNFLSQQDPHESLAVLNQLAQLGASESRTIKRTVDNVVNRIVENFDSNPAAFEEALEQLQPLVERQSRAFTGNVQRTVKASEGQQTLLNAQQDVAREVDRRLNGSRVPDILLKLLMPGWRNLLVHTHLRQGQDSAEWKQHTEVIDQLLQRLNPNTDPAKLKKLMQPEQLLERIDQGLGSIAFEPGLRTPLISSLRKALIDKDMDDINLVEMPGAGAAEVFGFMAREAKDDRRQELKKANESNPEWARCLLEAGNLHVGVWLQISDSPEESRIAIVAWVNDDNTAFVFVNRRGVKSHEFTVEELATLMLNGQAKVMEESDVPLTDRASHKMLQDMHNQLTHQATHDELTGLVNRKEFERELERSLGQAKRDNLNHFVAYFDLDQFKVINNTSGHEAGDQLLKNIAKLLQDDFADEPYILSRLGGDEYGVLFENCTEKTGMDRVKKMKGAIKAYRFDWKGMQFSLTASVGCVPVNHVTESVGSIMRAADSACFAAKDAGRDRIQIYQAGDSEMERRHDIMEFVSQIDKALEEDRFVLNCQKISPIDEDGEDRPHYEILLTVLDENSEPMPPQDFIIAAETYDRMGLIDRWVIKNAFEWIASHILKLDDLGAFSINLSGNSLNEPDFMDFVLEQFNRTRLPPSKICFEITETAAIGNLSSAIDFMEKMRMTGVQFSLDDFGTGLSSYSYLRSLPIDYLKIDGIFVKDIKSNLNDYALVKSINEIGHFMGKKTIAEYVEDDEILEILREIGVDFAQGYGIEKKMPLNDLL